jgi:hypothetical protein
VKRSQNNEKDEVKTKEIEDLLKSIIKEGERDKEIEKRKSYFERIGKIGFGVFKFAGKKSKTIMEQYMAIKLAEIWLKESCGIEEDEVEKEYFERVGREARKQREEVYKHYGVKSRGK